MEVGPVMTLTFFFPFTKRFNKLKLGSVSFFGGIVKKKKKIRINLFLSKFSVVLFKFYFIIIDL